MRMPDKHAFLSPSSSERWFNCTRSAWLSEQFPDLGSVFAAEGTEAHRLCEFLLHEMLGFPDTDPRPGMTYYTQEMEEAAQGYVQFIREKLEAWKAGGVLPTVFVEQRVDRRAFIPESMGTSDCVIIADDEIEIVDFKYGMVFQADFILLVTCQDPSLPGNDRRYGFAFFDFLIKFFPGFLGDRNIQRFEGFI